MNIAVCISTYQRPEMLEKLLLDLARQKTDGRFSISIVVADNDIAESARKTVTSLIPNFPIPLKYCVEPRRSIAHVRNKTLQESEGELIAFIDDDEFPEETWLLNLFDALEKYNCAGVLGPVMPFYPEGTPEWVKKGGFFERPRHPTGFQMSWHECRTGNVLFQRTTVVGLDPVFSPAFGTGGSDVDFFRRMIESGHQFVWCDSAAVFEHVPPSRCKRSVLLKRALLRGRNSLRHPRGRWPMIARSIVAVPLYVVALPVLQLTGHHNFMKFLVKLCDHSGRLMALMGIDLVKERPM